MLGAITMLDMYQVHGGVDLRLSTKGHPSHRRVPSDEAILRMAAQQRVRNLDPRLLVSSGSSPLPEVSKLSTGGLPTQPPSFSESLQRKPAESEDDEDSLAPEEKHSRESAAQRKQAEASAVFGERCFFTTTPHLCRQSFVLCNFCATLK